MITRMAHVPVPAAATRPVPDYLRPDVVQARIEQGRAAEHGTGEPAPGTISAKPPSYFRTYDAVKAAMYDLQARYPGLVEVQDIGDAYQKTVGAADRDILMLRLTAKGVNDGHKPSAFHVAGEHARELANPELLLRHAAQLLEGYGTDPEATAILRTRIVDVVPMMNPDGHEVIERQYAGDNSGKYMQRKNTSPPDGVDLNRNFGFRWGGAGASSNPVSDTYRGAYAESEPEVQAITQAIARSRPGIFVDWHSYSQLNLFPWGDIADHAPDHAGLEAVANKFSTMNRYTPMQSVGLYPTSGTSIDWAYGTHGIPSITVETGRSFHQTTYEFEQNWRENGPVMAYADKIADAPYERVLGPDVLSVAVSAPGTAPTDGGTSTTSLTASASDASSGGQHLAAAEYVLDPFVAPGSGISLQAADGAFDAPTEQLTGAVESPAGERQLVYVRAMDADGHWGPLTAQWVGKDPVPTTAQEARA